MNNDYYAMIANATGDLMTLIDRDYRYVVVNDAYAKAHNKSVDDIINCTVSDVWGADHFTQRIQQQLARCFAGETVQFQEWFFFSDSELRYFDVAYSPCSQDGEVTHVVSISRDKTEAHLTKELSAQQKVRLTIIESLGHWITGVLNLDKLFNKVVSLLQTTFDYRHVALFKIEGKKLNCVATASYNETFLSQGYKQDIEVGLIGSCATTGTPILSNNVHQDKRYYNVKKKGKRIQSELCIPIKVGSEIVGVLDIQSIKIDRFDQNDLTAMTILASQLAIAIENARLSESMRRTQKLESLGVMAGGIAHDFNNILAGIIIESEISQAKLLTANPVNKHLKRIVNIAERAGKFTHQLLAYSGKGNYQFQQLELNQFVQENLDFLQRGLSRSIQIKASLAPHKLYIKADSGQLQQVVMNLIINAAESYDNKTGTVIVKTTMRHLTAATSFPFSRLKSLPAGDYVCFLVQDTGTGMSPDVLERIFDPFFTTKQTGRGLGLAAIQGIVHGHGGDILVDTKLGQGTTFEVCLPALSHPFTGKSKMPASTHQKINSTILIIEDEELIRTALGDYLTLSGFKVLLAESGAVGLSHLETYASEIQLVLLDLTMPILSGQDTFHHIRQQLPELPVLFLSGFINNKLKEDLVDNNVAFLQKPVNLDLLKETIIQLIKNQGAVKKLTTP